RGALAGKSTRSPNERVLRAVRSWRYGRLALHELVQARHRLLELARVAAAGLSEVGAPATAAADDRGELLDDVARTVAARQLFGHRAHEQHATIRSLAAERN